MAVWTAPTTRSTGALVSASIWNTDIVENLKYLKDSPVFDGDISVGDDLFLTSTGAVINFASGDVTVTHSANTLTFAGASSGYAFNDGDVNVNARLKANTTMSVGNATPSTSGAGITFPAAQSASSDANTLDDYEEGTWTPIISDGTNNATMGGDNGGLYVKIGRQVFFTAQVTVNLIGSVGANAHVKGLPFTSASNTSNRSGVAFGFASSLNLAAAGRVMTGYVELNSQKIELQQWSATTGTATVAGSEISDNGAFFISGHYAI